MLRSCSASGSGLYNEAMVQLFGVNLGMSSAMIGVVVVECLLVDNARKNLKKDTQLVNSQQQAKPVNITVGRKAERIAVFSSESPDIHNCQFETEGQIKA